MFVDATVMQYTLTNLLGSDGCSKFADVLFHKYVARLMLGNVKCGMRDERWNL
jgi:hypothetical protein